MERVAKSTGKRKRSVKDEIEEKIQEANAILEEDNLQEIWRVGKLMKTLLETHDEGLMDKDMLVNIHFIWGTALSRLASSDNDATLAAAAADKFQEIDRLGGVEELGGTGLTLWAASLLIMGIGERNCVHLEQSLQKYELAASMNSSEFEIQYQYAKALNDVAEFCLYAKKHAVLNSKGIPFLAALPFTIQGLCLKALTTCESLYKHFHPLVCHKIQEIAEKRVVDDDEKETEAEEEEDCVTMEDISNLCLLHARILECMGRDEPDKCDPEKVYSMFLKSYDCFRDNAETITCLNSYLITNVGALGRHDANKLKTRLMWVGEQLRSMLFSNEDFPLDVAHLPVFDENSEELPPTHVVEMAEALGKNLLHQLIIINSEERNPKIDHMHTDIQQILKWTHQMNPELGCYSLAVYYAFTESVHGDGKFEKCKEWIETCESYGVVENDKGERIENDEMLATVARTCWFKEAVERMAKQEQE